MTRINHNISSLITQRTLSNANSSLSLSMEKLSSGLRINNSSDDPSGISVSESMRTKIRGNAMAMRNSLDGNSLLQIADGASGSITDMLQRMRELTIQANNDTFSSTQRVYLDQEFQQLKNEIQRVSESAQFNGMTLLDGGENSFGTIGSPSSVLHVGSSNALGIDTLTVNISAMTIGALGLSAANLTDRLDINGVIGTIDDAIDVINKSRSTIGAQMNRLDRTYDELDTARTRTQDAEAVIRDVDFATESTNMARAQVLNQSATAMLSQANSIPERILSIFG